MKIHNLDSAFDILMRHKITTHKESVRRWLRNGDLNGIAPVSQKDGWRIREGDLYAFILSRTPGDSVVNSDEMTKKAFKQMWWELVRKNIF